MSFLSRLFTKSSATQPDGIKTKHRRHRRLRWVHKWGGLFFTLFLIIFALSGIVLNHRVALSEVDVPRSVLPPEYRMEHWLSLIHI